MPAWTAEQDELLRANYWQGDLDLLCQQLGGRYRHSLWQRAKKLGLKRDPTLGKRSFRRMTARDIANR